MDVGMALVADAEAPEAGELGEAALDDSPVPSEMSAAVDATACDAADPTGLARPAAAPVVVVLVGVQLVRALARPTAACGPHVGTASNVAISIMLSGRGHR